MEEGSRITWGRGKNIYIQGEGVIYGAWIELDVFTCWNLYYLFFSSFLFKTYMSPRLGEK